MHLKYAIALTGGISTGKSSTIQIFSSFGFHFIDADQIAHQLLDEQHKAIAQMFGDACVQENKVNRKALGLVVFSDALKRRELEALLHPLIYEEIRQQALKLEVFKKPYLIDIPLFFEGGRYPIEKSLLVYTPKEKQLERLMQRDGYTQEEAITRINTQIPIDEKRKMADYIIDNSGTLLQLQNACESIKEKIEKDFT